ncbi:hypothetical protein PoB_004471200 [Plakobranchus ocellatus]|uniref:Uncharacterized protein n=1 Tax=Plakobranchus ocellatus TaxID=259542 RepID=A0AAV4BG37_9GAST|nr:hypothetical protein PoB_004471200 [Plakobranchus ocellatus]
MLLYMLSKSTSLEKNPYAFFETNYRQNEENSAHSAKAQALKITEDIFLPSQLTTIFALLWLNQPYMVHSLQWMTFGLREFIKGPSDFRSKERLRRRANQLE